MKTTKKQFKQIFTYEIDIFGDDPILICVGVDGDETMKFIEKKNPDIYKKRFKNDDWLKDALNDNTCEAKTIYMQDNDGTKTLAVHIHEWENNWKSWDLLLHELVHLKQYLWKIKGVTINEEEFEAYFIVWIFTDLRRILNRYWEKFIKDSKHKNK